MDNFLIAVRLRPTGESSKVTTVTEPWSVGRSLPQAAGKIDFRFWSVFSGSAESRSDGILSVVVY
jgi:hypothetical protein